MKRIRLSLFVCLLSICTIAASQEIRVGALEGSRQIFTSGSATIIDHSHPISAAGTLTTASVAWTDATEPCDNIFSVVFVGIPNNAFVAVVLAERGPFRAENGINTVALNPPVSVSSSTYIGVRRLAGAESCGKPFGRFTRHGASAIVAPVEFQNGSFTGISPISNYQLQAMASDAASVRVSTIPAVGSGPGNFGSFFRTSLTLSNPTELPINGKLVMRLLGRAGTDADPSLEYSIPANATIQYEDVVAAMGQAGLGSLDILTTGSNTPIATARVFNDAGDAGTSGLFEDAVPAGSSALSSGTILIPEDLSNYRLNIGIRTISAVTVNVEIYDAAGSRVRTLGKSYPAHYYEQVGAAQFTDGTVPEGGKVVVYAFDREFMVYGSVTDNRTNDPSMRIGLD